MKKLTGPFFLTYFIYYAGYTIFSSYVVYYLTNRGYNATFCGIITSLSLAANFLLQPAGGYVTDTWISLKKYLLLSSGAAALLCLLNAAAAEIPVACMILLVLTAGMAYPFAQLLDAWTVNAMRIDPSLVYSRIRAGGTLGFGIMSAAAGIYFRRFGWNSFFLIQAALFLLLMPLMSVLPDVEPKNGRQRRTSPAGGESPAADAQPENSLGFLQAFRTLAGNRRYMLLLLICTLYWFDHRPIGSYLSLIVEECGGDSGTYGMVCAVGAAAEYLTLLLIARLLARFRISLSARLFTAILLGILRPLIILLFPAAPMLYVAQILQSFSFAFFYSANVESLKEAADPQILNFSVSFGLMFSSVIGTVAANLSGGYFCDLYGTRSLMYLGIGAALVNLAVEWLSASKAAS